MAEANNFTEGNFREAVCIDAGRVYDSCCDRDCLEDLRCYFCPTDQQVIENAISIRLRCAEVLNVYVDVEQVNFNRGFYSCDLTFFFLLKFEVFTAPHSSPTEIKGISIFTKKVILYGGEGNVKVFSNITTINCAADKQSPIGDNGPKCVVQTVEPVVLSARLGIVDGNCEPSCIIPSCVTDALGGNVATGLQRGTRTVYATIGLFTVVQLIRNVQMLVPVYDFCIPEKQCSDISEQPCDVFRKIKFPTDDFFPPKTRCEKDINFGCSCDD